jgi:hypothetical protein
MTTKINLALLSRRAEARKHFGTIQADAAFSIGSYASGFTRAK